MTTFTAHAVRDLIIIVCVVFVVVGGAKAIQSHRPNLDANGNIAGLR